MSGRAAAAVRAKANAAAVWRGAAGHVVGEDGVGPPHAGAEGVRQEGGDGGGGTRAE